MIIAPKFYGDDNTTVMNIQHDEYGRIISEFVRRAIEKYRYAEAILNVQTLYPWSSSPEPGKKLPSPITGTFDHRVVQEPHDLIAAFFRFKEYLRGPLFKEEVDKADCIRRWYQFASQEIGELLEMPYFARAMVLAIAEQNNEIGYANEETMLELLKTRYCEMLHTTPPS